MWGIMGVSQNYDMMNEGHPVPKTGVRKIGLYLRMVIFDPRAGA